MKKDDKVVFFADNGAESDLWRVAVEVAQTKRGTYRLYVYGGEATRWFDHPDCWISEESALALSNAESFDEIVDVILGYLC